MKIPLVPSGFAFLVLAALMIPGSARGGEFDVVINEIHYHPHGDLPGDEFIELHNKGFTPVDLSGWFFDDGVLLWIPDGTVIPAGGFLVISPDRDRAIARHGLDPAIVLGNWSGTLDDGGEAVRLVNASGRPISRVRYDDDGPWPGMADGKGASLELAANHFDIDLPDVWEPSRTLGGTPGAPNSTVRTAPERLPVLGPNEDWRFFKGTAAPSPALEWTGAGFDDSAWPSGLAPFGYDDNNPAIAQTFLTLIGDMRNAYSTVYLRRSFILEAELFDAVGRGETRIELVIGYDDGVVAYVNGVEAARANAAGNPGDAVPFDAVSTRPDNSVLVVDLGSAGGALRAGVNAIAIQGLNGSLGSADFALAPSIQAIQLGGREAARGPAPLINEVRPSGPPAGPGFIEIFNPGDRPADIGGFTIVDSPERERPYRFPAGMLVPPRGFLSVRDSILGFPIGAAPRVYLLLEADGAAIADAFEARPGAPERSSGRFPDGEDDRFSMPEPTEGLPNRIPPESPVVINEIHYHPPSGASAEEFIELHNRSGEAVSLAGWSFSDGIDYAFAPDAAIPAGGFLVVAADPDAFRAAHPGVSVAGGHASGLKNDDEEIVLRDSLDNVADRLHYADDGDWPPEADGSGPSIELIHPVLDNRYGRAWRPGPAGGTPGAPNRSLAADPVPEAVAVRHAPVIPASGDAVQVRCRVLDTGPPRRVDLLWENDTLGGSGAAPMLDDGLAGDERAGDGVHIAAIPPQPQGSTVRFRILCEDAAGQSRTVPAAGGAYFLYEVHDRPARPADAESYIIVTTAASWNSLRTRGSGSDVLLDATFIDAIRDRAYYNVGLRYRGNSARNPGDGRFSYRVQLTDDRKFQGRKRLNLNAQNPHRQLFGNDFFRRAGIPSPQAIPITLRINHQDDGRYLRVEALDEQYLERQFGALDAGGNLYRGLDGNSNLTYLGPGFGPYQRSYRKVTNEDAADYSDVVELTRVLTQTSDAEFIAAVESRLDVAEWILYFAANAAVGNNENSIVLSAGDDYFLYNRPSDGRFLILPWDADSAFVDAAQVLFRPSSPAVRRLLTHPRYAPLYYCALIELAAGPMSQQAMADRLARAAGRYPPENLAEIENFVTSRLDFFERRIPQRIAAEPAQGGDTVIARGDVWTFFRGRSAPSANPLAWTALGFDDSQWEAGPSGFGYGDGDDSTLLDDMMNAYSTVFIRRRFQVEDPKAVTRMVLDIDWDDGFVAYINGIEAVRRNFTGAVALFDGLASPNREAGQAEAIDIAAAIPSLAAGDNVLAIVGLNGTLDSSDFSLIPALRIESAAAGAGCGSFIHAAGRAVSLSGTAPACATARVLVGGAEAAYAPAAARWSARVTLAPGKNVIDVSALDADGREVARQAIVIEAGGPLSPLPAQVAGILELTAAAGPYLLNGITRVEAGSRLRIGPGAVVFAGASGGIEVQGEIEVAGSAAAPVRFRRLACGDAWSGISAAGTGIAAADPVHRFEHCDFADLGDTTGGAVLRFANARGLVREAAFAGNERPAIEAVDAELTAERIRVRGAAAGVRAVRSAVAVRNSEFEGLLGRALLLDGDGAGPSSIEGCLVSGSLRTGIELLRSSARLRASIIAGCRTGISASGGAPRLEALIITDCLTALESAGGAAVSAAHLTLAANQAAVSIVPAAGGPSQAAIDGSIVWRNRAAVAPAGAAVAFTYSLVEGPEPWPGEGNILADPLFADLAARDLRLLPGSPAIGAGRGGSDMGAIPFAGPAAAFLRGDAEPDGALAITDSVVILSYLFLGVGEPPCPDSFDADDSGLIDITDAVYLLAHLFLGGAPPPPPYPDPGPDPTPDALGCSR